jgi:hypothetical protein
MWLVAAVFGTVQRETAFPWLQKPYPMDSTAQRLRFAGLKGRQ